MRNTGEGTLEKMITRDDDSRVRAGPGAEERLPLSRHLGEVTVAQMYTSSNKTWYAAVHGFAKSQT